MIGEQQNIQLMQSIHSQWGTAIANACHSSTVPEAFLAALIANESGGDPNAKRFERNVLSSLWELLQGRSAAFGNIGRDDVVAYITAADPGAADVSADGFPARLTRSMQQLDGLATSWGLTQVMGYEAISFGMRWFWLNPVTSLNLSLRMLAQFAERYQLDLAKDFSQLFDCWNTGRPHGRTYDPEYIPNGLARIDIYRSLLNEPPKAISA